MENEKDKKYFIIWLYISILLHLFVVIIMLTIKPTTSPTNDPDPASLNKETHIIFVQDEPATQSTPQESTPSQLDYQIANRVQALVEGNSDQDTPPMATKTQEIKEHNLHQAPLSDSYKKGLINQTTMQEQDLQGTTDIIETPLNQQEESQEALLISSSQDIQEKQNIIAEKLQAILQEKMHKQATFLNPELEQTQTQKIVSKKHRPADIGQENISTIQLTKSTEPVAAATKKKLSLQDIQEGFSQFVKNGSTTPQQISSSAGSLLGNNLYCSIIGNSDKDDPNGLKVASYMSQIGKMYRSAGTATSMLSNIQKHEKPNQDSVFGITIERSGKISDIVILQSCGVTSLDQYHKKIIEAIGDFPPIPKYIQAPLRVMTTLQFTRH